MLPRRQKKLKRSALVSAQVNDKDDVFVIQGAAPSASAKKAKPARKARPSVPIPAAQPTPTHAPSASRSPPQHAATSPARVPEAEKDDTSGDEAAEDGRADELEERMQAMAVAKAMEEIATASRAAGNGKKAVDRFTHQFDRKVLGDSEGKWTPAAGLVSWAASSCHCRARSH